MRGMGSSRNTSASGTRMIFCTLNPPRQHRAQRRAVPLSDREIGVPKRGSRGLELPLEQH